MGMDVFAKVTEGSEHSTPTIGLLGIDADK
jgi:hypothetical protein